MLIKVGELAARTNQTVRTLHHYDAIGLLTPSARSDAGYRLYDQHDVARLHAVLALRQFGLALNEIADMLNGQGLALTDILSRQIRVIDQHMAQSASLRGRLELLQSQLSKGTEPDMNEWLRTLARMNAFHKYLTPPELKRILDRQAQTGPDWNHLFVDVQAAMDQGHAPDSPPVQLLAQRWISLMIDWMDGDFELMERWGEAYRNEPLAYTPQCPSPAMVAFIGTATELHKQAYLRHLSMAELTQLRPLPEADWVKLAKKCRELNGKGEPPSGLAAKRFVNAWASDALARAGHSADLLAKIYHAIRQEPLLQMTDGPREEVHRYLGKALAAQNHPLALTAKTT